MMENKREKKIEKYYKYDVIVIGGGHAGSEAALASSRSGPKTLMITINIDSVALMQCNCAIGGPGRGQLVREIDALDGEIAKNSDKCFINSRMLNSSRGPALQTIRSIIDKRLYFLSMKERLENQDNLDLKQGLVTNIRQEKGGYSVSTSDENCYKCKSIVIATGTFLRGKIFWGKFEMPAGRQGEINSINLVQSLEKMGYRFGRLRTETPPRIDKKTVNFSSLKVQPYDAHPSMFSFENEYDGREQIDTHVTYIEQGCIDFIKENIKKSATFERNLESRSPKYCPSIEDKIQRFSEKERHIVFIQPEGKNTNELYLNGLFTTFPEDIQQKVINMLKGLENAIISRPGYGVEYDYLAPFQINSDLESKKHKNIFFAGQINGSTGYEEAAAQGLVAGLNDALGARGRKKIIIGRSDGYIGVLIDDIVLKGVHEPYRMLTSRNEYRLSNRHDNADIRMSGFLKKAGNLQKAETIEKKYKDIDEALFKFKKSSIYSDPAFMEDLKQDRLNQSSLDSLPEKLNINRKMLESVIINLKYENYLQRENERINQLKDYGTVKIPDHICYENIKNLSKEALVSLNEHNPETVGQASRLEGVRPLDVLSIIAHIRNVSRET